MARGKPGPFGRSEVAAARAFLDSVVTGAGSVPISRRTVDPAAWSDTYALRVANRLRSDAADGVPLSLQRARRGPKLVTARRLREGHAPVRIRSTGLVSQESRSAATLIRRLREHPDFPNGAYQITASGTLLPEYGGPGSVLRVFGTIDTWRTLLTGFGGTLASGVTGNEYETVDLTADDLVREASAVFDRVETYELRAFPAGS